MKIRKEARSGTRGGKENNYVVRNAGWGSVKEREGNINVFIYQNKGVKIYEELKTRLRRA